MALYGAAVEYALHTMLNLHRASSDPTRKGAPSGRELAEFQRLPVAFTRRLLTQLERAGLIRSAEGIRGGWSFARPADRITVWDVVHAVSDGGGEVFTCADVRERCALWDDGDAPRVAVTGVCSIHAVMRRAEEAMRAELRAVTIADLGDQLAGKTSAAATRAVPIWFDEQRRRRRPARTGASTSAVHR
jgi:Rrf2 family protein